MTRTERAKAWYDLQISKPYGKFDEPGFHMLGIMLDQADRITEVDDYGRPRLPIEELLAALSVEESRDDK